VTAAEADFDLTLDELRLVARYAAEAAQKVLSIFEEQSPGDARPRAAIEAAVAFADGAPRTNLQRVTALEAHRAAKDSSVRTAHHAAMAAGDAAASAYLHPLAKATQVGHILRSCAHAACALEAQTGDEPRTGDAAIEITAQHTSPAIREILLRYPAAVHGKTRVAQLMKDLDTSLRTRP
jgi:hypothetical protein